MKADLQKAGWSRWLNWTPQQRILGDSTKDEPTKPTKLPAEEHETGPETPGVAEPGGFVGAEEGDFQKIEGQSVSHGLSHDTAVGSDGAAPGPQADVDFDPRIICKVPRGEPSKPTNLPAEQRRASALAFVNRAAARIVCPDCYPGCPTGAKFAILVPAVNDTPEFQAALQALGLKHLPVLHRDLPLGFRPEVEHARRQTGSSSDHYVGAYTG